METYQPLTTKRDFQQGIRCQNKSGEEMPAFAAMMITGESGGTYEITKPTEDSAKQVLLGPPNAVPNDGIFFAVSPYDELVATSETTPGDEVGTVSGSWEMEAGQTGFVILSGSGGAARVRPFRTTPSPSIDSFFTSPERKLTSSPTPEGGNYYSLESSKILIPFSIAEKTSMFWDNTLFSSDNVAVMRITVRFWDDSDVMVGDVKAGGCQSRSTSDFNDRMQINQSNLAWTGGLDIGIYGTLISSLDLTNATKFSFYLISLLEFQATMQYRLGRNGFEGATIFFV